METQSKTLLVQITEQELRNYITVAVKSAVDEIKNEIDKNKHERPVLAKELAQFLSCSTDSILIKANNRLLPHYRFEGKRTPFYFFKSQVLEVLKTGQVHTWKELGIDNYEFLNVKKF